MFERLAGTRSAVGRLAEVGSRYRHARFPGTVEAGGGRLPHPGWGARGVGLRRKVSSMAQERSRSWGSRPTGVRPGARGTCRPPDPAHLRRGGRGRRRTAAARASEQRRRSTETLDVLDGLLFSGGSDLDPDTYGAESHPETNGDRPRARPAPSSRSCEAALERDMPVLAVCRGSQMLNVALGGDLVQHLPDVVGRREAQAHAGRVRRPRRRVAPRQRVWADPRRPRARQEPPPPGLGRLGEGLARPPGPRTARSRRSRTRAARFALGVLWHPEEGEDSRSSRRWSTEARALPRARPMSEPS